MKRRRFLQTVPFAGFGLGTIAPAMRSQSDLFGDRGSYTSMTLERKVMLAMLTMQRATWEQGVAMQAMLEMGKGELVILMAKEAVLRQSEDGRLAMLGEEFALSDAASPGEAVLWAARKTGDQGLQRGVDRMVEYLLHHAPRSDEGIIYHFSNLPQIWSDIIYMLPPFFAAVGLYNEAVTQIDGARGYLWDSKKGLLSHMWDCQKKVFVRKDCWGVGNGWSAAGITRVIRALPDAMSKEKEKLVGYVLAILDGCLAHIRSDGLFHNIVDDPATFVETNLAQMLAYSIYRGIKGRWIDNRYRKHADTMRDSVRRTVDELGLVQGVCGSPEFNHPGTATEGQAFFLMMEAARSDLTN